MLTFTLGTDILRPLTSTTYVHGYLVKYHLRVGINAGETIVLNTGVIFSHGTNEYLDVTLSSNLTSKNLQLVKFSVDAHPDRESNVSDQNKPLRLHIVNNDSIKQYIEIGEIVCEVVSVNNISQHKVTIAESIPQPTQGELEYVDITTIGTAEAEKALVLDSSSNITGINSITASNLTLDGVQIIDNTNAEAFLVRKDADAGDIFLVDTSNNYVNVLSSRLGVNQATPSSQIHIKQSADDATGGLRFEENGDTNYWGIFMDATDILQFHYNGTDLGFVNTAGTDIAMNFTGQHRSSTDNDNINANIDNYVGMIVSTTGNHKNLNNAELTVNDALPIVDLSSVDNDKTVFGVISAKEDENENRTYQTGIFATYVEKDSGDERLFINSLGEGMVWVCNKGGNFTNGDLITSSSASGYGQLQADDLLHNYTVGKVTQNCDFSTPERYVDALGNQVVQATYDADPDNHYKCNFIACVYYCG